MFTITSKTTKDELVKEVVRLQAERKQIVTTARDYAKRYRWCEVVDEALREAGLGDQLPPEYLIEYKPSGRAKWQEYDGPYSEDEKDDAIALACQERNEAIEPPASSGSIYINEMVFGLEDAEALVERIKAESATAFADITKHKAPKYPIYRVVLRQGKDITEVAVFDQMEKREVD